MRIGSKVGILGRRGRARRSSVFRSVWGCGCARLPSVISSHCLDGRLDGRYDTSSLAPRVIEKCPYVQKSSIRVYV